jgi:hypothetical protein
MVGLQPPRVELHESATGVTERQLLSLRWHLGWQQRFCQDEADETAHPIERERLAACTPQSEHQASVETRMLEQRFDERERVAIDSSLALHLDGELVETAEEQVLEVGEVSVERRPSHPSSPADVGDLQSLPSALHDELDQGSPECPARVAYPRVENG